MTSPKCRLFLVAPSTGTPDALAQTFEAAIGAGDIASLLIDGSGDTQAMKQTVKRLMPIAHANDIAVLIDAGPELAKDLGADGIEIEPEAGQYEQARARLGPDAIIGIRAGSNRHQAMSLAEKGADYCGFDQSARLPGGETLIAWWAELFTVPVVAREPARPEQTSDLVATGVDFLVPDPAMWASPHQAETIVSQTMRAIREASP